MAFSKGLSDRPESLMFRSHQSPREEAPFPTTFPSPLSPLRTLNGRVNQGLAAATATATTTAEGRGSLQRRFTTNALPTLSPIAQQRRQAADPAMTAFTKTTPSSSHASFVPPLALPSERKARQYEELLAQQRRIQAQMALIDPETRREVDEHQRLEQDITMYTAGHQSEPNTPPEYYNSIHRVNNSRFSNASLASPPGIPTRLSRPGSQLTSPQTNLARPYASQPFTTMPSKSVPASRRGSDEDEEEDYANGFTDGTHRAAANLNRNSMPVKMGDLSSVLGSVNTTGFLFGDEDDHRPVHQQNHSASPDARTYLQLHANDDKFPILVRREGDGNMQLSASSAALDLALSQSPGPENQPTTDRATANRHRQSLPPSAMRQTTFVGGEAPQSPLNIYITDLNTAKNTAANRRSLEVKFSGITDQPKRPGLVASPKHPGMNGFPKLQSSYSTNDIPTLKSTNSVSFPSDNASGAVKSPRLDFTSPDRQNPVALNGLNGLNGFQTPNRQPQDTQNGSSKPKEHSNGLLAQQSVLQASAVPFGPGPSVTSPSQEAANHGSNNITNSGGPISSPPMQPYGGPAYYGGYGMQMLGNGFSNMGLYNQGGNQGGNQWQGHASQTPAYQNGFGGYSQQFPQQQQQQHQQQQPTQPVSGRYADSQSRVVQQRRVQNGEDNARFANVKLESLVGEIYGLCKDQHGCRYLQKKLEDRDEEHIKIIFEETSPHVIELMTDPFGNYLCQKLLEYANDDQRTVLIRNAAPSMVKIALNQHGTRALQKMIEFISTKEQIQTITEALRFEVVPLIQDLNGNHVIQKCLNHLSSKDAQFIFDAVGTNCVTVGTHRHGCCVLQRCIDHASGIQKGQIVHHITMNAFTLVQDPFGNYVVQYILDLGEPAFSRPLSESFLGNVAALSKQKFSSNVVEKSIRTSDENTRRLLVEEISNPNELERLLRDSYANYVVQTAMDYADQEMKTLLVDNIRPILPSIRHTPYGRRIAGKIQEYDGRMNGGVSGAMSPTGPMSPVQLSATPYRSGGSSSVSAYNSPLGSNYGATGMASPTPHRNQHGSLNMLAQPGQQSHGFSPGFAPVGRAGRPTGMGHF